MRCDWLWSQMTKIAIVYSARAGVEICYAGGLYSDVRPATKLRTPLD